MKRTSTSRSSLFLMELIIAILFFSLVSAVCLKAFTRSHILNQNASDLNAALTRVESTAELLRTGKSVTPKVYYNSSWETCEEGQAAYVIRVKEVPASDSGLSAYKITARSLDTSKKIYSLSVSHHTPHTTKEASGHE